MEAREYDLEVSGVEIKARFTESEHGMCVELEAPAPAVFAKRSAIIQFVTSVLPSGIRTPAQWLIGAKLPTEPPAEPIEYNIWGTSIHIDRDKLVVKLANIGQDTVHRLLDNEA